MLRNRLALKGLCIVLLVTISLLLLASPVLAYLYRAAFTITESNGTDYTALAVNCSVDVDWMIDNGFITTATALDTRIETLGGVEQKHMMAEDRIMAFAPSLDGDSQLNWYLTTGNSALSSFPVITGYGGNVTISDHADLELSNNFSIEFNGYPGAPTVAFPQVAGNVTSIKDAAGTSHSVSLPGGVQADDLLLVFFSARSATNTPTITWPGNWTSLITDYYTFDGYVVDSVAYKVADGDEGSTTTITTATSAVSAHQAFRITDYQGVPVASATGDTGTATPNPPSLSSSWEVSYGTLWIAGFGGGRNADRALSSYPTDYTDGHFTKTSAGYSYVGSARRELMASSEDPGVFTLSDVIYGHAWTVGIQGHSKPLSVIKDLAFGALWDSTGVTANILGGTFKTLTVPNPPSVECTVNVWADTSDFGIDIGGVTENSTALGGASVPGNANDYLVTMPYFNCFNLTVSDTLRLRYEPDSLIEGTTLPNEENPGTHDGTISWGSNPNGVTVTLGSLTAPESTVITEGEEGGYQGAMREVEVTDWFLEPDVGTKLAAHPLRPLVTIWSDNSTVTEVQAWRFLGLALLLLLTVSSAILVRGHLLIAGLACGGTIALLVQQTVWPGWTLVFIIPAIVAGVMAERTPSIG